MEQSREWKKRAKKINKIRIEFTRIGDVLFNYHVLYTRSTLDPYVCIDTANKLLCYRVTLFVCSILNFRLYCLVAAFCLLWLSVFANSYEVYIYVLYLWGILVCALCSFVECHRQFFSFSAHAMAKGVWCCYYCCLD